MGITGQGVWAMKSENLLLPLKKWQLIVPLFAVSAMFPPLADAWNPPQASYYEQVFTQAIMDPQQARRALIEVRLQRLMQKARAQHAKIEQWHKRAQLNHNKARLAGKKNRVKTALSR